MKTLKTKARAVLGFSNLGASAAPTEEQLLVVIFLRGGADGLSMVAPYADDGYYRNRVLTALPRPRSTASKSLIDLDGFYGLHPSLAPLYPLYREGQLAFVHACGSGDRTLSHFVASDTVERGQYSGQGGASGWLSRYLDATSSRGTDSVVRAVSMTALLPASLAGSSCAMALQNIDDLLIHNRFNPGTFDVEMLLRQMYQGNDFLSEVSSQTLAMVDRLRDVPKSSHAGTYQADTLSQNLRQVAELARCDTGLSVASIDQSGYDTHVAQGAADGTMSQRLTSLATALAAFVADLGPRRFRSTRIVVMSEFGRRAHENDGGGTDHGHGNMMMVLGGDGVNGGRVHGLWQPLNGAGLDQNGNLVVTTDYRDVLADIVISQVGMHNLQSVFPGLSYRPVGVSSND